MQYDVFKKEARNVPVLKEQYVRFFAKGDQSLRNQMTRWTQAGKLVRLKKGLYVLNDEDRKITPSRQFLAAELYQPSYISMEYALSYYGIIPERVVDVTSITTRKTMSFTNVFGTFRYQHIVTRAFTGFVEMKDESGLPYHCAEPEKAVVDFLYLNRHALHDNAHRVLHESFRFQHCERLSKKKLYRYAALFQNARLEIIVREV